jgi:hypothetical protein
MTGTFEVDLVMQEGLKIDLVEFKATQTILPDLFKGLQYFEQHSGKKLLTKTMVYGGTEFQKRTIADVVPWMEFAK